MSANIYLGGRKAPSLDRIACYLSGADVVFLQEVDRDAAETLARESGLENFRFAMDEGMAQGEYGVAILSRSPLGSSEVRKLTKTKPSYDVILKTTTVAGGERVGLINAFYQAGYDEEGRRGRLEATRIVLDLVDRIRVPLIIGGDLNATSERPGIPQLSGPATDAFAAAATEDRFHCPEPWGRIDYVFFRGPFTVNEYSAACWPLEGNEIPQDVARGCSLGGATLSDHPFVRVELETRP
jgi:endonuclease/exonuclease/phosphatase family metal-dependent hydrolase